MNKLIIVCGPVGVGKTTYSIKLSDELNAVKFSIDPWMHTLFSKDMATLDYSWIMERVKRCENQILETCVQILTTGGRVVLDLGFTTKIQRRIFVEAAAKIGIEGEVHYLVAPKEVRKQRVMKRNIEKDPQVYSFEVTDQMFTFMEPRFEIPDEHELKNGKTIDLIEIGR